VVGRIVLPKHFFFFIATYTNYGFAAHPFYRFIIFKLQWAEKLRFFYSYDQVRAKNRKLGIFEKVDSFESHIKNENECSGEAGRVDLSVPGLLNLFTALCYYDFGGKVDLVLIRKHHFLTEKCNLCEGIN